MDQMRVDKIDLNGALVNVDALDDLKLEDQQPCIEAINESLHYVANMDSNFMDKSGFLCAQAKYVEQATLHADLNLLLEEGQQYAVMLYTWRSCSRAFPQVHSNEQENRLEIYETIVEIMQPYVDRLIQFMFFQNRAIDTFCGEVKRLCHKEKRNDFVLQAYLLTLGKFINMFAELDELKNVKSSVTNDYAAYKRAAQCLKISSDMECMQVMQNLSMNLATKSSIRTTLRQQLISINGHENLLSDIVTTCVRMYETRLYVEPSEKYLLVKVMATALFLMDREEGVNVYKMDAKKRFDSISKMDRILKELTYVPLYGDIQIMPYNIVKQTPNFDPSKWPCCESSSASTQSNLLSSMSDIRRNHMDFISRISQINNENSWKLMNPTEPDRDNDVPKTSEPYERATRYNYSPQEKFAMVEVIGMIKGLQVLMGRMEAVFMDAIRRSIYLQLQEMIQLFLREPLRKAIKHKYDIVVRVIKSIRETCVDWHRGFEPVNDPAMDGKKDPDGGFCISLPRRNVGPSSTQLYMVRTMLESLIATKSLLKQVDSRYLSQIVDFHQRSFFWTYVINFNQTLFSCCNLSQLWYREFFLEMTMGQRIQFPIEMSMPWVLTDFILDTKEPSMMEFVLYPMDLYNDSADFALHKFRKQFLYDEIEAEVNLCFDQFVYKISDQILAYFKQLAGSILLDKQFRAECIRGGEKIPFPTANRFETILRQRHVQLLGRSIDLNGLIAQQIASAMYSFLNVAIERFESTDLTGIMELEMLIECNRLAHRLLLQYVELADFDDMLREANHNVSAPYGRITLHIFWELIYDLVPNYCFNGATDRFVKVPSFMIKSSKRNKAPSAPLYYYLWGSKKLNMSFNAIFSAYSEFIGTPHLRAMCHLLGYQGFAVVVEELLKSSEILFKGSLSEYVCQLMKVLPDKCKMQAYSYGSPGILQYYLAMLNDVIQYAELKSEVFQRMKEFGNTVIFCRLMEHVMNMEEQMDLMSAAPFQNAFPKPYVKKNAEGSAKNKSTVQMAADTDVAMSALEEKYSSQQIVPLVCQIGSPMQQDIVKQADVLTRERLCCGLSVFRQLLKRVKGMLTDRPWSRVVSNGVAFSVDECSEFHRLWSALNFVICLPVGEHEFTVEQMFGEGLTWAGCVLVTVLGQQRRFLMLDFCSHLLNVHQVDMKLLKGDDVVKGIGLKKMVDRIRKFQIHSTQIFSTLNKYLDSSEKSAMENVRCFLPPIAD